MSVSVEISDSETTPRQCWALWNGLTPEAQSVLKKRFRFKPPADQPDWETSRQIAEIMQEAPEKTEHMRQGRQ